ncbi:hypothetical protein [Agrobacterium vitis]|nr:hypothetical protein [Agrobacterium vitis]
MFFRAHKINLASIRLSGTLSLPQADVSQAKLFKNTQREHIDDHFD